MRNCLIYIFVTVAVVTSFSQVSINNFGASPDSSAMLDIQSTTGGVLIPRMTSVQRELINSPATGLLVFDIDVNSFWFYNGTSWQGLSENAIPDRISDADGDTQITVEDSTDENIIRFKVAGNEVARMEGKVLHLGDFHCLSIGDDAGYTSLGFNNTHVGYQAGYSGLGTNNSLFGAYCGTETQGAENTMFGTFAGYKNTQGGGNVFVGSNAGYKNSNGNNNIFIGTNSGYENQNHSGNICIGESSGKVIKGHGNTLLGSETGFTSTNGAYNVFLGYRAGYAEQGSNKLYIANSNTSSPLIYGDFAAGLLRVNGTLNINNAYTIPSADGGSGQVLQTDGEGIVSWQDINLGDVLSTGNDAGGNGITNLGAVAAVSFSGDGSALTNINVNDADSNPTNEIQDLESVLGQGNDANGYGLINLGPVSAASFSGNGAGLTNINVNDADHDPANEIQNISQVLAQGNNAQGQALTNLGSVSASSFAGDGSGLTNLNVDVNDADADPNNELQDLTSVLMLGGEASGENILNAGKITADTLNATRINGFKLPTNNGLTGQRLITDGNGILGWSYSGDSFGNHTATQNIRLFDHWISNDGDNEGVFVDNAGNTGIGLNNPMTILEVDDSVPEMRITNNSDNASGTGNLLGTLSWWSRDASFGTEYESLASIEIINTNGTATPDAKMAFNVWDHQPGEYFKRTPLVLNPDGSSVFNGDVKMGTNAEYSPAVSGTKLTLACAIIDYEGNLFSGTAVAEIASITHENTGEYTVYFTSGIYFSPPSVTVTPLTSGSVYASITIIGSDYVTVRTKDANGTPTDVGFTLIATGQSTY